MSKRARSPSTANDKAETSPATKTVCIQLVIDPLAYQLILCELVPRTMVDLCRWNALMAWKDVSKDARASVMVFLREMLQPRYTALVNALFKWEKLPLDTRFEFPELRGPLVLNWVDGFPDGYRDAVRPKHARASETLMPRALWVWAMTHSLFDTKDFPKADIGAAVNECKALYPHNYLIEEPAFMIMSDLEKHKKSHPNHFERWSEASKHTIPAVVSTFTCWKYHGSMNMGAPGNQQRFLKTLLNQTWPTRNDLPYAIAFLLLWAQHTLFHTWVIDDTFRQSAIDRLVAEFILEWRQVEFVDAIKDQCAADEEKLASRWSFFVDWESLSLFRYWFKTDPAELKMDPKKRECAIRRFEHEMENGRRQFAKIKVKVTLAMKADE